MRGTRARGPDAAGGRRPLHRRGAAEEPARRLCPTRTADSGRRLHRPLVPTALVAKQAAELSLLSGGRFQLGVCISWNQAEYEALGQDFKTRGRRLEEQIVVLRRLWTEPFVTFEGRFHKLNSVGLNQ